MAEAVCAFLPHRGDTVAFDDALLIVDSIESFPQIGLACVTYVVVRTVDADGYGFDVMVATEKRVELVDLY